MSDLISRSALIERCEVIADCEWNHRAAPVSWADAYEAFADMVEDAPAVDAVKVVKCKDCYYWMKAKVNRNGGLVCPKSGMEITATDYCSRAEKRECHYDR